MEASANTIDFLKKSLFFRDMELADLQKLTKLFVEKTFASGKNVVMKGTPSTSMFVILKGTVRIHDGGHVFGLLESGDVFGEYALLDTLPRSASVTTLGECKLLVLENDKLSRNKNLRTKVFQSVVMALTSRLRSHNELEEKLATAFSRIKMQKSQLEADKKKIERKNAELTQLEEELREQKRELEDQRDELKASLKLIRKQNEEIMLKNEEINAQNEEIRAQRDELEKQRDQLLGKKD